jgi:hypothetical protein
MIADQTKSGKCDSDLGKALFNRQKMKSRHLTNDHRQPQKKGLSFDQLKLIG